MDSVLFAKMSVRWAFLKNGDDQDSLDFVHFSICAPFLPDDGQQATNLQNLHGDPDLCPHSVFRVAVKHLELQVLFDLFEK
jgi:hypothetical protein